MATFNSISRFLKQVFFIAFLLTVLGMQKGKAQSCSDITVTETPTNATLSPVNNEDITYVFSNSNSNIAYHNFTITINLPLGIAYNSYYPLPTGVTYVSNGLTSVIFSVAPAGALSSSNPISIKISAQTPCAPGSPAITAVTLTNVGGNLPSSICNPTINTSLTLATPILVVNTYWNGAPLSNIVLDQNTGDISDLCFELTNSDLNGVIPRLFASFTPDLSTQLLGYAITNSYNIPGSYSLVPISPALINSPLLPNKNTYVHFQYKVINSGNSCPAPGGTYTFSYGLNAPPSAQCQSIPVNTFIEAQAGTPIISETATSSTNSIFCSNNGSNTMPVTFQITNIGHTINGYEPGNAKATHLQLMVVASNDLGTIDINSFKINGVPLPANIVSPPAVIISPNYIDPTLQSNPVNAPALDLSRYNYYFIDFTKLKVGAIPALNPSDPFVSGLQDIDGDGYVDDLSDVGDNTFTLTATFTYNSSPPAEFATCGADKEVYAASILAYYLDQCLNRPVSSENGAQNSASYHYSSQAGAANVLNLPKDVEGDFTLSVCPEYSQYWTPEAGALNEVTFPATPPYGFDFLCPNGYDNIHIDMPYGFTLNSTSPPLTPVPLHSNEFYLPPITVTPPNLGRGNSYTVTPIVTVNSEVCNTTPPSLDINLGRLPLSDVSGSWYTYPMPCLDVPIQPNCIGDACVSSLNAWQPFDYTFQYVCGGTGCSNWTDNMACANNATFIHCPGSCPPTSQFDIPENPSPQFTFVRTNMGYVNSDAYNSCTNLPGPIVPNTSVINTSAAYPGDQVEATTTGTFLGNPSQFSNMFLEINYNQFPVNNCEDPNSYAFDFDITKTSTVIVSGGSTPALGSLHPVPYTLTAANFSNIGGSGLSPVGMCFSPPPALQAALSADNFPEPLMQFVYDVHLVAKTGPLPVGWISFFSPGKHELKNLRADFVGVTNALHTGPPGDTLTSCDTWGAEFNMLQPSLSFQEENNGGSVSCGTYTYFFGFLSVNALEAYAQKDFPNEFRPYAQLAPSFTVDIPTGWQYVSSQLVINDAANISSPLLDNGFQGSSIGQQTFNVSPNVSGNPNVGGQIVRFNGLSNAVPCWPLSDENYLGGPYANYGIDLVLQPFCSLQAFNNPGMPNGPPTIETFTVTGVSYTQAVQQTDPTLAPLYQQITNLPAQTYQELAHFTPILSVNPQSSVDVKTNTFTYDITINEGAGYDAPYTWLTITDPNSYFNIIGATLIGYPPVFNIIRSVGSTMIDVGDIQALTSYTLEVTATVNPIVCSNFSGNNPINYNVDVSWGNECTGFPTPPVEPNCTMGGPQPISFSIFPATLNLVNTTHPITPVDLCDGILNYTFDIENPDGGTVGDPQFWMTLPTGVSFVSAAFTYPYTLNPYSTTGIFPINGGSGWDFTQPFTSPNAPPLLPNGLVGFDVNNLNNNQVGVSVTLKTDCTYNPSQPIGFYVGGNDICGQPLNIPPYLSNPPFNGVNPPDNLATTISINNPPTCNTNGTVTVKVTNNGPATLNNNMLTVSIPDPNSNLSTSNYNPAATVTPGNPILITWTIGALANLQTATFTFDLGIIGQVNCPNNVTITAAVSYSNNATCTPTGGSCPVNYSYSPAMITVNACCQCNDIASTTVTNVLCNGQSTGSATASSNGVAPFTYSWSNSQTNATATGLSAGIYTVTVTDNNGCTATATATITEPDALTVTTGSIVNVNCNGASTGAVTATAGGGTVPYNYNWTPSGGTNALASNLSAGTYTVTITDANGCMVTATATITQINAISVTTSVINNVSCNGGNNGSARAHVIGGSPLYMYVWSNGETSSIATGLTAGTYTVTVTDKNGCTATATSTITQPAALTVTTGSIVNVNCNGASTGAATATAGGGTVPYNYNWAPAGGTNATATGLSAGTYTVTVTDANGCIVITTATIAQPNGLGVTTGSIVNVLCNGQSTGSATATATSGTAPYDYSWAPHGGTNATAGNLTAGTYTVTVTDANGCTATATATITQPAALTVNITGAVAEIIIYCNGGVVAGGIEASLNGGTPGFSYVWSNGKTTAIITGITAGTYSVTVTDANGCTATTSVNITQPNALTVGVSGHNAGCNNNNGSATATANGGTSPYLYSWNTNPIQTNATATGLSAGTYTVTVTDANNCTATASITISQVNLTATMYVSDVSCNGANDGSASVVPSGGIMPYAYLWNNGNTTNTISNLSPGTYSVTVTDANGCTATAIANITQPVALTYTVTVNNALCNNANSGSATVINVLGGTPAYNYIWTPGNNTNLIIGRNANITGLSVGTYSVEVSDQHKCLTIETVIITQQTITVTASVITNVSCNGGSNGSATVAVSGGTMPFVYAWSNGKTTSTISGLIMGVYTVTVIDANGCTGTSSVTISQPAPLSVTINTMPECVSVVTRGGSTAYSSVSGGTGPFTYRWSTGSTTSSTTGLYPGPTYTLLVIDANGCTATASTNVYINNLVVFVNPLNIKPTCLLAVNGQATVTVLSGTSPYTYVWTPHGGTNATASTLSAATYTVTVTDKHGCTATASATIGTDNLGVSVVTTPDCFNLNNGTATAIVTPGIGPWTYAWSNSSTFGSLFGLTGGSYSVTVTDHNGCTAFATGFVSTNCRNSHGKETGDSDSLTGKSVNVFPNPANSVLNIETQLDEGEVENICLYNTFGQQVRCTELSDNITTISISNLAAGVYFYRITDTSGNLVHSDKVVIIH